jgi:lipoprotein-anchoring transpeptidase ErfK/SrfK
MQRSLASARVVSLVAAGTVALLIPFEAQAEQLLDPGWQLTYQGAQPNAVTSGFIAHTFGDRPGPYAAPGAYRPATVYYRPAPPQPGAYREGAPQYYAVPAQQLRAYQPPTPQYYAVVPAQEGRGYQPAPAYYQPAAVPQPGAYPGAPQYYLSAAGNDWAPGYAPSTRGDMIHPVLDPAFERQVVDYRGGEKAGTIIIDTPHFFLYLVMEGGKALRYGIGVGRAGFTWAGMKEVSAMREWPDWRPPDDMLRRRPDLPRYMAGGPENPLGARAIYLGSTLYRIHGSNEPWTIGTQVSSGCIRLRNEDVIDLYQRVKIGNKVIVI